LVERYHWVWIWMGDPDKADPALIPNWWWADHADWAFTRPERVHVKCNYQLVSDNVLDVTHLAFVHASSIGAASIARSAWCGSRAGSGTARRRRSTGRRAPFPATSTAGRSSSTRRRASR